MIPEVSALYATGDIEATRECIDQTVQLFMVVSAPCAMGLAVLAQPIVFFALRKFHGLAANLLILGSVFDPAQWNVKYFQMEFCRQSDKAEDSGDYGCNRTGCGHCGSGSAAVFTANLGVYALLIAMVIYSVVYVC